MFLCLDSVSFFVSEIRVIMTGFDLASRRITLLKVFLMHVTLFQDSCLWSCLTFRLRSSNIDAQSTDSVFSTCKSLSTWSWRRAFRVNGPHVQRSLETNLNSFLSFIIWCCSSISLRLFQPSLLSSFVIFNISSEWSTNTFVGRASSMHPVHLFKNFARIGKTKSTLLKLFFFFQHPLHAFYPKQFIDMCLCFFYWKVCIQPENIILFPYSYNCRPARPQ